MLVFSSTKQHNARNRADNRKDYLNSGIRSVVLYKGQAQAFSEQIMQVLVKFKIRGLVRYLSHAEMMKVFQRACVRSGFKLRYSRGYNPHPKMSIPLPKSVGLEGDEEMLCIYIERGGNDNSSVFTESEAEELKSALSEQLPEGCELLEVKGADESLTLHPYMVTYSLFLSEGQPGPQSKRLRDRINSVLCSDEQVLERYKGPGKKVQKKNVRPFVKTIELHNNIVTVECRVSSAGSIRVDEILRLLELEASELEKPVRRTKILWKEN